MGVVVGEFPFDSVICLDDNCIRFYKEIDLIFMGIGSVLIVSGLVIHKKKDTLGLILTLVGVSILVLGVIGPWLSEPFFGQPGTEPLV